MKTAINTPAQGNPSRRDLLLISAMAAPPRNLAPLPAAPPPLPSHPSRQLQKKLGNVEYVTPDKIDTHPVGRVVGVLKRMWKAQTMGEICQSMGV